MTTLTTILRVSTDEQPEHQIQLPIINEWIAAELDGYLQQVIEPRIRRRYGFHVNIDILK